jgi:hypothetical protein
MNLRQRRRFVAKLTVALAFAAIAAPVAAAGTDTGIGIPAGRDVGSPSQPVFSENGRGQHVQVSSVPLISEHGLGQTPASKPSEVAVSSPGTFDWTDAGIGAGAGFVLLLSAGAVHAGRRQRALAVR